MSSGNGTCVDCGNRAWHQGMRCEPCHRAHYCYMQHFRGQQEAIRLVGEAIRAGEIPHPSTLQCADCGRPAEQYDHRDYSLPLSVDPVCRKHNIRRGRATPREFSAHEIVCIARSVMRFRGFHHREKLAYLARWPKLQAALPGAPADVLYAIATIGEEASA